MLGKVLDAAIERLHRSDAPRLDALLLLERATGKRREWIVAHGDAPVSGEELDRFERDCARRERGEPVAYILGEAGFYGRTFAVDARVLIPRPETEHLVADALAFLARRPGANAILDVGTGSGAIACTLAAENPNVVATGVDRSKDALAVARRNAERLGLAARYAFECGDLAGPVAGRRFDVVLANLPYVPSAEVPQVPEPAGFEPAAALDGGPDGLGLYRRFVPQVPGLLRPGGLLLLEAAPPVMPGLLDIVRAAFAGLEPSVCEDYGGRARYVRLALG